MTFKFTDQANRSRFQVMQSLRSSVLRLLSIEPSALVWNKRSELYAKSTRLSISTFSTDPRRRRNFGNPPLPNEDEEDQRRPALDEVTQKK
jgi:hypothetical protein